MRGQNLIQRDSRWVAVSWNNAAGFLEPPQRAFGAASSNAIDRSSVKAEPVEIVLQNHDVSAGQ